MSWLARIFAGRKEERDLAEELQQHLAERVEVLLGEGVPRPEAEWTARRELGNVLLIQERGRDVWRWALIEDAWADLRYALRQLRRAPLFAIAAVLTLGLGIGANTAVFSLVNAVLLRPLPFPEPERLVAVRSIDRRDGHLTNLSYPTFFDFRRANRVFERIVCYRDEAFTLTGRGQPLQVTGEIVSWDFLPLLGVQPALGRGFLPTEEARGQHVVILSHVLWSTHFGADPGVVGGSVTIDGQPHAVVGVAPAGFNFPIGNRQAQIWTTLARDAASATVTPVTEQRGARMLDALARLDGGVSLPAAQVHLDGVATALAAAYPDQNGNLARASVRPELERLVGRTREAILLLFGAVALVLAIACANIAGMLLARTADREREFGIRLAIGGSRGRVIRQLVTENLCLSALGSAAGVALAVLALDLVLPFIGDHVPRAAEAGLDGAVLAFSVGLTLLTALVVSIPPALRIVRMDTDGSLRGRTLGATDDRDRLRGVLVVAQIAIGLVLSSGATILVADFVHMMGKDLGFRPDHLLAFQIGLSDPRYPAEGQVDFIGRLLERLRATPGVAGAAAAMPLPLIGDQMTVSFDIEERRAPPPERPRSDMAIVTPDYFRTIGTPLLDGRHFSEHDDDLAPPVLVVNQAFATRFFPNGRAVGKRIEPGATGRRGTMMREIVGVVGNARQSAFGPRPEPIYYFPYKQMPWGPPTIIVRTEAPPLALEPTVRRVVMDLDKDVPLYGTDTIDAILKSAVAGPRFIVFLMTTFAGMALLLTAIGIYGVLAYAVLRRTREIGVRIALGATRARVVTLMLRRALTLLAVGMPIGIAGALAAGRPLAHLSFEHAPFRPLLLVLTCAMVAATAAMAAYLPARRAASIDPARALRTD